MTRLWFLFLLPAAISAVDPQQPLTRRCPGGYTEGALVVLGRYWYHCTNGQLVPKGCIDFEGRRVDLYATMDSVSQAYRFECTIDRDGFLTFEYKACLYDGKPYSINEKWRDSRYVYKCIKEGDHLRTDVVGCVDSGREVGINEKVSKGHFVYQCKKSENGTCSVCPVGCAMGGREYLIGDTFEDDQFWYSCERAPDKRIRLQPLGCVHDGQRLKDGEHFFKNELVYECQVTSGDVIEKVVGCAARHDRGDMIEKQFGDVWNEGQFEVKCKHDQTKDSVRKVSVRCIYKTAVGVVIANIDPGCYRILERRVIGCFKDPGSEHLVMKSYLIDEIGVASSEGLRHC